VNVAQVSVPSIPVSGTVNVGNAPNVNVANTPTVHLAAGSNINVSNAVDRLGNTIPLAIVDAAQQYEDGCSMDLTVQIACSFQPVPSGKRLVIQEADFNVAIDRGLRPFTVKFSGGGTGPTTVDHYFSVTFVGGTPTFDSFASHQETRLYVV
jgi:hypothetical protein